MIIQKTLPLLAAGLTLAAAPALAATTPAPPNILFIAVDDWNDWMPNMGDNQAKTPQIDKLMSQGVTFTNAHCAAPYCAPSRAALMTGRAPHTTGCYDDEPFFAEANHPDIVDLPRFFRQNGFAVHGGGKIYHHMHGQIDLRGWDSYFHWNPELKKNAWVMDFWFGPAPRPNPVPYSPHARHRYEGALANDPNRERKVLGHMEWGPLKNEDEARMADTLMIDWACAQLGKEHDKPFFLGVGLYAPHAPRYVPQKYFDLHPLADIQLPPIKEDDMDDIPDGKMKKMLLDQKSWIWDVVQKLDCHKEAIQAYLAQLSYADAMIGRVLDALAASPHADNTIIVLWSDNGYHLGEKTKFAKHTLWERTSNVPLVFAGPGVARGEIVSTTASLLDIYPTLASLCGLPEQNELEGADLKDVLANPSTATDRTVLITDSDSFAAINNSFRYIRYGDGGEELYDTQNDPHEWHNLANNPEYAEAKERMAAHIPKNPAPRAHGPKNKENPLVLRTKGETFEWVTPGSKQSR